MASQLGQSIVVENKAGAADARFGDGRPRRDGYTMPVHSSAHTITPALYPKLNYDITPADFVTVGAIGSVPNVMHASRHRRASRSGEGVSVL